MLGKEEDILYNLDIMDKSKELSDADFSEVSSFCHIHTDSDFSSFASLKDKGLIDYKKSHKRISDITITEYGREMLEHIKENDNQRYFISLPCKLGTTVYVIPTKENGFKDIVKMKLLGYTIGEPCDVANLFSVNRFDKSVPKMYQPSIDDFGKTWFLSKEVAYLHTKQ